jgi:hypothetical protein
MKRYCCDRKSDRKSDDHQKTDAGRFRSDAVTYRLQTKFGCAPAIEIEIGEIAAMAAELIAVALSWFHGVHSFDGAGSCPNGAWLP